MNVASTTWHEESPNSTSNLLHIYDIMTYSTYKQGNFNHAIQLTKKLVELDPKILDQSKKNLEIFENGLKAQIEKAKRENTYDVEQILNRIQNERVPLFIEELDETLELRNDYEALCRGKIPELTKARQRKLFCRYINYHPSLIIAPVKEEIIYDQPKIWVFHDVITNKQIGIMKKLAFPKVVIFLAPNLNKIIFNYWINKLHRAFVGIGDSKRTADFRISQNGWLDEKEHPTLEHMTNLVVSVTNLSLKTADRWQIANYGLGGYYKPHYDYLPVFFFCIN